MNKLTVIFSTIILTGLVALAGCSGEPTQLDCMSDYGQVSYGGECVDYFEVPEYDREDVLIDVADEIAERDGITREEALEFMYDTMVEVQSKY